VAPLLAVASELAKEHPAIELLFVGTRQGPERKMVEGAGLPFQSMPAAKFRRYFSLANFTDAFVFLYSFWAARRILKQFKPDMVFGAGGYVAVPLSWVAWMMGIKVGLHQQDAGIGLANRMIAPVTDVITATFKHTAKQFYSGSGLEDKQLRPPAEWVGNPIRLEFFTPASPDARQRLGLAGELPVLLITGGATGAAQINEVVAECAQELAKSHQVIHVTGLGKIVPMPPLENYRQVEFLTKDMPDAMKLADIVITRAGISTISELSALGKVSVVVPMPGSHQEDNAALLKDHSAAVVLGPDEFTAEELPRIINSLKFNVARQKLLAENISGIMPHDAASRIAQIIASHAGK